MAKPVLDIIAEYPKVEHIAKDMEDPSMHKHGGENSEDGMYRLSRFKGYDVVRNSPVRIDNLLAVNVCKELEQENEDIQPDQPNSDKRKRSRRIVVFIGKHSI